MAEIGTAIAVTIPTPSVTAGPLWAQEVSDFLAEVNDGFVAGVRSSVGLTVDADLTMGGFVLTGCGGVGLLAVAAPVGATQRLYALTGGELHYVDLAGNDVQITSSGSLNAASLGGINGDYGAGNAADVSYVDATSTFVFTQDPGVSSKLDTGDIRLRETVASALAVTIKSPASLAGAYDFILPPAVPAFTKLLQMDSGGAVTATDAPVVTTLEVDSLTVDTLATTPSLISGTITAVGAVTFGSTASVAGTLTVTGDVTVTGGTHTVSAPRITTAEASIRHGTKRIGLAPSSGMLASYANAPTVAPGSITASGSGAFVLFFDLVTPLVGTLSEVSFRVLSSASTKPTMKLWSIAVATGVATQIGTTQTAATTGVEILILSALATTLSTATRIVVEVGINASAQAVYPGYFEYSNP